MTRMKMAAPDQPARTARTTYGKVFYCRTHLDFENRTEKKQYRGVIRDGATGKILWETASWGQADRLKFDPSEAYDGMRKHALTMGVPVDLHHPVTGKMEMLGA